MPSQDFHSDTPVSSFQSPRAPLLCMVCLQEVVEKVLGECNGCPLAIAIVAHSLRKCNGVGGWRRFLDVWSKSTLLYKNTKNPASDGRHESLYAAIQLSLDAPPDAAVGLARHPVAADLIGR